MAKSGQSTPRTRRFGRTRYGSSTGGGFRRIWITATCAIVNESIAPNAYMRPMKSTLPGSMNRIEKTPAKTISASHGVLKRGCSRRNTSGSCR